MRWWTLALAALLVVLTNTSLTGQTQSVVLRRGTPVRLTMGYPVSVSASKIGQQIRWMVAEDVAADGVPLIAKGAMAMATVTTVFNVGGTHRLSMRLETVELATGGSVALIAQSDGNRILNFLTTPSDDAVVPEGSETTAFVGTTVTVPRSRAVARNGVAQAGATVTIGILSDGTPVHLRFARAVSSATAQVGDRIALVVTEPVQVAGVAVVPQGSTAWATVTEAKMARDYGRRGRLGVTVDFVRLGNGQQAALRANKETQGEGKALTTWGPAAVMGPLGGGIFAAAEEGNDVEIPRGKVLTAYVNGDLPVTVAAPVVPGAAAEAPTEARTTQVDISSTPAGADIEVDGKFVGNTPSSIALASGTHKISVLKRGYRAWTRTVSTSGGSVRLSAELVRSAAKAK